MACHLLHFGLFERTAAVSFHALVGKMVMLLDRHFMTVYLLKKRQVIGTLLIIRHLLMHSPLFASCLHWLNPIVYEDRILIHVYVEVISVRVISGD